MTNPINGPLGQISELDDLKLYRAAQVGKAWQVGPRRMERLCRAFETIGHAIQRDGEWYITNFATDEITLRSNWEAGRAMREGRAVEKDARSSAKVFSGAMLDLAIDNLFNGEWKAFDLFDFKGIQ